MDRNDPCCFSIIALRIKLSSFEFEKMLQYSSQQYTLMWETMNGGWGWLPNSSVVNDWLIESHCLLIMNTSANMWNAIAINIILELAWEITKW
jgi:hypothetical protein